MTIKLTSCLLPLVLLAADVPASQVHDATLITLQNEIARAIVTRDLATLERLYAPEFIFITGAGEMKTRDQVLAETRQGDTRFHELEYFDVTAARYGETSVVTGRGRGLYTVGSERFDTPVRFTRVHVLRNGVWQVVLYQVTRVPPP